MVVGCTYGSKLVVMVDGDGYGDDDGVGNGHFMVYSGLLLWFCDVCNSIIVKVMVDGNGDGDG